MWNPWELREDADYDRTLAEARDGVDGERFQRNLHALRFALKRDPRGLSEPFLEDETRIAWTRDEFAGYQLAMFFRIEAEYVLTMKWIARVPI